MTTTEGRPAAPGLFALFLITAMGPLGLHSLVPALPALGEVFAAPHARVQLTISLFLLMFGLMQLLLGPLSDRIGRRPVLLGAVGLYVAASLFGASATSIDEVIWARALQAAGGCAALVIPRAIIRDTYSGLAVVRPMAIASMALTVVPALAPLAGGFLVSSLGWSSIFMFCAAYGCGLWVWLYLRFRETWRADATAPRATLLGQLTGYLGLLRSRAYLAYTVNFATVSVGFLVFVSVAPVLLIRELGLSPRVYGFCHLLLAAGVMAGAALSPRCSARYGLGRTLLVSSLAACVALAVMLAWPGPLNVAGLLVPTILYSFTNGLSFPLALTAATGQHPRAAGASAAFVGAVQMAFGALAVHVVNQFGASVQPFALFSLASAVLGTLALALVPRGPAAPSPARPAPHPSAQETAHDRTR